MQIRADNDAFSMYGSPSRPISPTSLSAPLKRTTTVGNESGEITNQTATTVSQPEFESHQQQHHHQQSTTFPSAFPPELIDHIVDHLHDDKQSLIQCSRTSRVFSHATSYHLLRTVRIPSVRQCVEFQELVRSSLHPFPSASTTSRPLSPSSLFLSASSTSSKSTSPPASCTTQNQITQTHLRSDHLPHMGHAHASTCDVLAGGWDISKFVRRIEFYRLGPPSPIEEYVSEAAKLVRMLPRVREVVFGWMQATGLERIGRAFAATSPAAGHSHLANRPPPSAAAHTLCTNDPLKLHLELVDFDSVRSFLDFLGSFGGRLRELSLRSVNLGGSGGGSGDNGKDDVEGRCFPGLESVSLGYDAVAQPNGLGGDGPTMGAMMNMNLLFGISAFDRARDVCEILESVAPNVSELQLFRDDDAGLCTGQARIRLPRFRRLKSMTMNVPGPSWSDLIYEIAAWFTKEKLAEEIADLTCHDGRASPSLPVIPSMPSTSSVTRGEWETRIRFAYPIRKGDVDWNRLESAVLGEGTEGLDGGHHCARYGNNEFGTERESGDGDGSDHVHEMLMRINEVGKDGAHGGYSRQPTAGSLWVEAGSGSATLGEVRGELRRLDKLGLLQVSCG